MMEKEAILPLSKTYRKLRSIFPCVVEVPQSMITHTDRGSRTMCIGAKALRTIIPESLGLNIRWGNRRGQLKNKNGDVIAIISTVEETPFMYLMKSTKITFKIHWIQNA